jgi:hypothetical protein
MNDFKYNNANNYPKKLSVSDSRNSSSSSTTTSTTMNNNLTATSNVHSFVDENIKRPQQQQQHSRLKKSFSECEYYENENNRPASCTFGMEKSSNLSPSKRVKVNEHRHVDDISFIDTGNNQRLYNYDTMKSQYLLQQQQKLKEYKNDPNYLNNGENYTNDFTATTETKGILKNASKISTSNTDSYQRNSLKRNKGHSTLSLCSCDADTEVSVRLDIDIDNIKNFIYKRMLCLRN